MTKQESFKRSVRARMAETGEKYGAARRALIERSSGRDAGAGRSQPWVEQPETSDQAVREATGRGWDEWCDLIDSWPERTQGHAAMAARMGRDHLDSGWWAQSVVVGYERIRGLRVPYLRADGTFAASVTRTITTDPDRLRAELLDPATGAAIAASANGPTRSGEPLEVELRSRPESKSIRWAIHPDQGRVRFAIDAVDDGRARVSIQHERLDSTAAVERWKDFWAVWLASRDESG